MNIYIDTSFIKNKRTTKIEDEIITLLEACAQAGISLTNPHIQLCPHWPSLLISLNLESLFADFFKFDAQNPLFALIISTLETNQDKELLIHLYDQLFAECLTHIKNLPQVNPQFLVEQIQSKRQNALSPPFSPLIISLFDHYEKLIRENPTHARHDLILYLAWDRICVCLALIFEYNSAISDIKPGLDILRECLLESFQHITAHGRTVPSFFRLIEALYAYEMRAENLQTYSEEEWLTLCQGAQALKNREEIADLFYIDGAIIDSQYLEKLNSTGETLKIFTLEPPKNVEASLLLARYFVEKLKLITSEWHYTLRPLEVGCLSLSEQGYVIQKVCH